MFRTVQDATISKTIMNNTPDPTFSPIVTSDQLLGTEKRRAILRKLPMLLGLSETDYQSQVTPLIEKFAEFVQALPETRNNYYAQAGGFLDHALERSSAALTLLRGYFVNDGKETVTLSKPQTLWAYAVFSASVLYGIGKIAVDFSIQVYDKNGGSAKAWQPFAGSLLTQGHQYSYEMQTNFQENFKTRSSLLLARQLMPKEGFAWIAENKEVLSVWMALIDDDVFEAGTLGAVLSRADAQAILKYFESLRAAESSMGSRFGTFTGGDNRDRTGTKLGTDLLNWINAKLAEGALALGEAVLISSDGKPVVTNELIAKFAKENPHALSAQAVKESLLRLGVHSGSGEQSFAKAGSSVVQKGHKLTSLDLVVPHSLTAEALKIASSLQFSVIQQQEISRIKSAAQSQINAAGNIVSVAAESTSNKFGPKNKG